MIMLYLSILMLIITIAILIASIKYKYLGAFIMMSVMTVYNVFNILMWVENVSR